MTHHALLLGASGASPEGRDFESKVTDHDILPEDFVLLEPGRWYESVLRLLPWWKRRGLYSLQGWLFSNGRLDLVETIPIDLDILERWPSGSIPQIKHRPAQLEEVPPAAGTVQVPSGTAQNGTGHAQRDQAEPETAAEPEKPSWVIEGDKDRERIYAGMQRQSCGCLKWLRGNNGNGRPKAHMTVVQDGVKVKKSATVYVVVYEWVHGPRSAEPSLDHKCHTYDATCPGQSPCTNPRCDNPMHPYGEPCQHTLCCEPEHLESCGLREQSVRRRAQENAYAQWLAQWQAERLAAV